MTDWSLFLIREGKEVETIVIAPPHIIVSPPPLAKVTSKGFKGPTLFFNLFIFVLFLFWDPDFRD